MTQTKTLNIAMIEDEPFSRLALMEILKSILIITKNPNSNLFTVTFRCRSSVVSVIHPNSSRY